MSRSDLRRIHLDPAACEAWVAAHPAATVFHRRPWVELVARIAGGEPRWLGLGDAGGLCAVLPAVVLKRGPFRILASPPPQAAAPYMGPLARPGVCRRAVLEGLVVEARRAGMRYAEVRLPPGWDPTDLTGAGWLAAERATFVLDLTPGEEALWKRSLTPACRRAVRKAERAGVEVREESLAAIAPDYARLAAGVFARWNRPPPLDERDYREIAATAERSRCVRVLVARRGGAIAAAGIFPYDAHTVYYLDGVSDPAHLDCRPNNILHWEVIRWACAAGLRRYDMVGAGIPGVARFKKTFGPREVRYLYGYRHLSPWARVARSLYAACAPVARAVWFRLRR